MAKQWALPLVVLCVRHRRVLRGYVLTGNGFTTSGLVMNICEVLPTITMKSAGRGESRAAAPMMSEICGITAQGVLRLRRHRP